MKFLKRWAKRNSHNVILKPFAGLGKSIYRLYENRNHDHRSNGELRVLTKLNAIRPQTIFDIGANVGEYAILTKGACPAAKLYCFEPVSATFDQLKKNLANVQANDVELINMGMSDKSEKLKINIYEASAHSSIYDIKGLDSAAQNQESIEVTTGDAFMEQSEISAVDFIKLDIEGEEMNALKGFSKALEQKKIRAIQFEYGYINITTKDLLSDFYDFFHAHGYQLGKIYPKSVEFREYSFKHEDFMGPNYLAIQKEDLELKKLLG